MKSKERIIVTLIALLLFAFTSVGYAVYSIQTNISGSATFAKNGEVVISSAILSDHKNLLNPINPTVNGNNIHFDLNFNVEATQEALQDDYYALYTITITNGSFYDYVFQTSGFNPTLSTSQNPNYELSYELNGLQLGDTIPSLESVTYTLKIIMTPNNVGEFNVSGDNELDLEPETPTGRVVGSIPSPTTGDLTSPSNSIPITATVMNTYETAKTFNITVSNSNFYLVDNNGNALSTMTIGANATTNYTVYLKVNSSARFASDHQSMNIYLEPVGGDRMSMGVVTATVTVDDTLVDVTPPSISNVSATQQTTNGSVLVTYTGSDNVAIDHYQIDVYSVVNDTETLVKTGNTQSDETQYTVTGLNEGNYYFKVTAHDTSGNTASSSNTASEYRWVMNVHIAITQGGPNGDYTVNYGGTYTATITANNNRNRPDTLTITMGGVTLATGNYTYNANNGSLRIPNVTGDLNISGETTANTCLVEGTKVLLGDNTYKNIEDISYDDLLMVWSYDTGSLIREYPLWIEKKKVSNVYTKITFSDSSTINIVGAHAFFSNDKKKFVAATNQDDFHIGTNILKVVDGSLKNVSVIDIEEIQEEVSYYFVASTRYYNIISEDFVTTDAYTDITNLYEFNDSIKWVNKGVEEIPYSYLEDVLPYYLFKGFRVGELAVLLNNGSTTLDSFKQYISSWIVSDFMIEKPFEKDGSRVWAVSNSESSIKEYIKEGEFYTLPEGDWYSTSENKIYHSFDKVPVWTGMYFEKITES